MALTTDDIRNKNKDLLLTDAITDDEIETALTDAKATVKMRLGEIFDSTITDAQFSSDLELCQKLIAASTLIKDNYTDNKEALEVARDYYSEANSNIKSLVSGNKLQKSEILPFRKSVSYKSDVDTQADTYITNISTKYR